MSLAEREDMKRAMIGSRAFVLDKDKADEFLRQKADTKLIERIYRNADKFEKNNIKANKEYEKGYNKAIDDVTKLVEFLIADLDVEGCTKYGNKNAEQEKKSYDTLMKYEIAGSIDDLLDRLERLKS